MPTFSTVLDVVNQVAGEVGVNRVTDPFLTSDPSMAKLLALLTVAGQELALEAENGWSPLRLQHDFTVDGVTVDTSGVYDLPNGFQGIVDGTPWNRTTSWPFYSLSGTRLAAVEANAIGGELFTPMMRIQGNKLHVFPRPVTVGTRITFEYASEFWVASAGASAPSRAAPSAATDVVWYPFLLITRLLRLRYLQAVGLDSTAAQVDYERTLGRSSGKDKMAGALSIVGPRSGKRYLDEDNVPETGYGGD